MNITLSGTKVSMDGHTLAFQKNNLVDSMVITVDTDETWQYKLDVKYPCKDSNGKELYNVIDLTRVGNTCTAILQASMLPFNGKYTMQLRGISGNKVYHTDTFDVWVKYSIDPGKVYDPVPSEFYQIEQAVTEQAANAKQSATESAESATNAAASATKAENAVVHSPIIGENGNWFIWDFEKSEYVDSGKSASTPPITPDTAGKYLTNDGSKAEWGVMSGGTDLSLGITGAQVGQIVKITEVDTDGKPTEWQAVNDRLPSVSPSDVGRVLSVEQIGEFEYGYGFTDIPDINTFIPLGITDASPGQFAKVKYVDDIGQPTAWEAVDAAGGGSPFSFDLIVDHTVTAEDLTVIRFNWTNETIQDLGKYNLFYAVIESDTEFSLTKWVKFYINNSPVSQFSGILNPKCKTIPATCNRFFGKWIGTCVYSPVNSVPFPTLVGPCENVYRTADALNSAEDAMSISIGSYATDFGLAVGMRIKVYAMI